MKHIVYSLTCFLLLITSSVSLSKEASVKLAENPFAGSTLLIPSGPEASAAVLMLHGSGGGSRGGKQLAEAAILASSGVAVLRFCYFDCKRRIVGKRESLKDVSLENIVKAINWLRVQSFNKSKKVFVVGASRGAELALLLSSLATEMNYHIDGVAAHAPSNVLVGPFNWDWKNKRCWYCPHGKTCTKRLDYAWNSICGDSPRKVNKQLSPWRYKGELLKAGKRIEVENYKGPVLISHGESDQVWSYKRSKHIQSKLRNKKNAEFHFYPEEGHGFSIEAENKRKQLLLSFILKNI